MDVGGWSIRVTWQRETRCRLVGRGHFDNYTAQNRVKHAILSKYFGAYLQALSRSAEAFHYIDAFAGPGTSTINCFWNRSATPNSR